MVFSYITQKQAIVCKGLDLDLEFAKTLEETVSEWASEEDDKLYANL